MKKLRRKKKRIYRDNFQAKATHASREQLVAPTINYFDDLNPSDYYYALAGGKPALYHFLFSIDSLAIWLLITEYLSYLLFKVPDFTRIPPYANTMIGASLMASAINRFVFLAQLVIRRKSARTDPRYIVRFMTATFLSNMLSATAFTVGFLYYFGAIDFVAAFLQKIWPYLSDKVTYIVSTVLNWMASGIIGGATFQFIKNKFGKKGKSVNNT
jgi:hypothetical protein